MKEQQMKTCKTCADSFDDGHTIDCRILGCTDYNLWRDGKEEYIDEIDNPYNCQVGGTHYKEDYPFCEPLEFFSKNNIPFTKANVCKYVLRHDRKDGIQDLMKAKHYLEVICWDEYGQVL